jgi:hypothetical protein
MNPCRLSYNQLETNTPENKSVELIDREDKSRCTRGGCQTINIYKTKMMTSSYGINAEVGAINTRNLMRSWLSLPWQGPLRAAGRPAPPDLTATLVREQSALGPHARHLQCKKS